MSSIAFRTAYIPETHRQRHSIKADQPNQRAQQRHARAPPTSAHPHPRHQISIACGGHRTHPHARSFTGGFRTTAPVQAASSRLAVIRNPSQKRKWRRFQVMSALPHKADIDARDCDVRFVPKHKVAALQPAAREQEPRGRHPVERTAMAGWQGHVLSACNAWSRTARIIWQAGTLMRRVTSTPPYDKVLLTNSANQFA